MPAMLSIKAAMSAHATRSNRVWDEDRSQTVGASEIGQCARRVWFSKFAADEGVAVDGDYADRWGARVRGTVYEREWWEPALRAAFGDQLRFAGDEQRTLYRDFLSATPDGLIAGLPSDALANLGVADIEGGCIAIECKTADPRTKLDGPKAEHRHQLIVQLGLIRSTTPFRPMWGLITYTDASFWDEVKEFPVRFDEAVFNASLARATTIMTAADPFQLRPEGWIAGGKECDGCPFTRACGQVRAEAASESKGNAVPDGIASRLGEMARAARKHAATAKTEAAAARAIEEKIKTELSRQGARSVQHGGVSVTWSAVAGRPSTDLKALREAAEAAGVDTRRFQTAGAPSDRLTITIKTEADA